MLLVLLLPSSALAWGPFSHIHFASSFLYESLQAINPVLFALLSRYSLDFLYGNIAADIVLGKNASSYIAHCHNWDNAYRLFRVAGSDRAVVADPGRTKAFIYGYLAHLAADVVAHNQFVPLKRIETYEGRVFGHAMWEIRLDRILRGRADTEKLFRAITAGNMTQHDEFLGRHMFGTVFKNFRLNKRIFESMIGVQKGRRWEGMTSFAHDVSKWELSDEEIEGYVDAVRSRLTVFFASPDDNPLGAVDPRGMVAMAVARQIRREIRKAWQQGAIKAASGEDIHSVFQPYFAAIARGEPVAAPNLSELFTLQSVDERDPERKRTKTLLVRMVNEALERRRERRRRDLAPAARASRVERRRGGDHGSDRR